MRQAQPIATVTEAAGARWRGAAWRRAGTRRPGCRFSIYRICGRPTESKYRGAMSAEFALLTNAHRNWSAQVAP